MNLPNSGITWKDYKITTPTFQLSPVEKPDLSPFLMHLTGKNQLVNILKGENAPEDFEVPERNGFIKSSIPSFYQNESLYNSCVVCFTESPIFALDFFRYRSYNRWRTDQQYGIGFSKEALIKHRDVRPVIYLDTNTNTQFLSICNKILNETYTVTDENGEIRDLKPIFKSMKPFLFPLLEEKPDQGFMWEREWRCPYEIGMTFHLKSIRVICCPKNEKDEILAILGDLANNIQIVESWREYDDVTSYLKRRRKEIDTTSLERLDSVADLSVLQSLKEKNDQTLHTLDAYYGLFKETVNQLEQKSISDTLQDLKKTSKLITERMTNVTAELKVKEEADKLKRENKRR